MRARTFVQACSAVNNGVDEEGRDIRGRGSAAEVAGGDGDAAAARAAQEQRVHALHCGGARQPGMGEGARSNELSFPASQRTGAAVLHRCERCAARARQLHRLGDHRLDGLDSGW